MPFHQINDIRIAYEEVGTGDPLLLIMGLGAPGSLWEQHIAAYARHFRCIVMDNRGAGRSDKPMGPYSTAQMADDAAGLLEKLEIGSARVAGISMGSGIAQELALRHPAQVKSMVLISSWARVDTYMREVFLQFQDVRPNLSPAAFTRLLQLWIFAPGYFEENLAALDESKAASERDSAMAMHAFNAQCQACTSHDTLARLSSVTQPCLLTVGDQDIFTPLRFSTEMAAKLPHARLEVFQGAGHCHHWEKLAAFNEISVKFLLEHT